MPTLAMSSRFTSESLKPVRPWLDDPDVVEIAANGPGRVWIERLGADAMVAADVPELDARAIRFLAERVAAASDQSVNAETPLLSAALPGGERIQVVLPPASEGGSFAIRKQVVRDLSLDAYERMGAFDHVAITREGMLSETDRTLIRRLEDGDVREFLETAVERRVSLIISGGTSTGKTTFMNALLSVIPRAERLVSLEDTRELAPPHPNYVALLASRSGQGTARVTMLSLLEAALRMRPDRIFLGELRGEEAFPFLRAVNTGHPGSMTTVHADTPAGAYEQIALMVAQARVNWDKGELMGYIRTVMPIVVQLRRDGGRRGVSEIYFARAADGRT